MNKRTRSTLVSWLREADILIFINGVCVLIDIGMSTRFNVLKAKRSIIFLLKNFWLVGWGDTYAQRSVLITIGSYSPLCALTKSQI